MAYFSNGSEGEVFDKAVALAKILKVELGQERVSVVAPNITFMIGEE